MCVGPCFVSCKLRKLFLGLPAPLHRAKGFWHTLAHLAVPLIKTKLKSIAFSRLRFGLRHSVRLTSSSFIPLPGHSPFQLSTIPHHCENCASIVMSSFSPSELMYMESHIDDNRSGQVYATNVVCALAAYLAILLRLFARSMTKARYGLDDWLVVVSLVSMDVYLTVRLIAD